MKTITITILDSEEIENITSDSIKEDNVTATHYNNIKNIIDVLTAEKKAMDKALIAKHDNKTYKDDMISTSVYDSFVLNMQSLADDIGIDKVNEHKTQVKHTERVVRFGK